MGETRKSFTTEYKRNAVALVIEDGRTIAEVARGIGMSPQTLGNWVAKTRAIEPADKKLNETEREELERLRHENADLRMKYEFSRKVAAWFAKDQQ